MSKNSTGRALMMSVLSLLLCVSMLVGTTFAWFTDSVQSGINQIVAGNLDIDLEYKKVVNGVATDWAPVQDEDELFDPYALWEPGRVEIVYLKVSNLGSLALKYQLGVNVESETIGKTENGDDVRLSEHLVFKVVQMPDALTTYTDREAVKLAAGTEKGLKDYNGETKALDPKDGTNDEDYVALIVYMPTTVGNEANYRGTDIPTILLGVNLYATQKNAESDSFGPDYDEDAWNNFMKVYNAQDLQAALSNGQNVTLMDNIVLNESIVVPAATAVGYGLRATPVYTVIDMNGHGITIASAYDDANALASSAVVNNGHLLLTGEGTIKATDNYSVRNYGVMVIDGITVENGVMNFGDLTVESGNISNSRSGKHAIYGNNAILTVNGGTIHNGNPGNATIFSYAGAVTINNGEISIVDGATVPGWTQNWTSCLLDAQGNAQFEINGGVIKGEIRDYNKNTAIYGGTFTHASFKNFVAEGAVSVDNKDGSWSVYTADSVLTMEDGATLDLNGVQFPGKIVALGDLTIKGDTTIKTLSATNGGTITIEEGKKLTLTNFSFGTKSNASAQYTITGGTVAASYGFFQHGKYELHSDFETGYMYYSYGSDITVYGTLHSQGKGDGLDYVRGKLTIAKGGKSIHDKALWIGQPESWGAMNATMIIEEGAYVQANTLSLHAGSSLYLNAKNIVNGEDISLKYNTMNADGDLYYVVANADELATAVASGATNLYLQDGEYDVYGCQGKTLNLSGSKNAVLKVMNEGEDGCDYAFGYAQFGHVTFNGLTIDTFANNGNYKGYAYMNAVYNDCTFVGNGFATVNAGTYVFNGCTFDLDGYVWTWGATQLDFNNCEFIGDSRSILAHGGGKTMINIDGCNFTATEKGYTAGGDNTAAVEIDPHPDTIHYTINITNSTMNENYNGWTRVKDSSKGHMITIDGVTVTPITNAQPAPYVGDCYEEGTNVVAYKDLTLSGDAYISIDSNASVAIENVKADVNGSVVVMKDYQPAIYINGGEFTIGEGEYLIDASAVPGGVYQIFLVNVKVNGEYLTQESAAQYLNNVNWYGAYQFDGE